MTWRFDSVDSVGNWGIFDDNGIQQFNVSEEAITPVHLGEFSTFDLAEMAVRTATEEKPGAGQVPADTKALISAGNKLVREWRTDTFGNSLGMRMEVACEEWEAALAAVRAPGEKTT